MATNTYVALDEVTVVTATPSITFTNISQEYTDLVLVLSGTKTGAGGEGIAFRVGNGSLDTDSNYSDTILWGNGSSAGSARTTSQTRNRITYYAAWIAGTISMDVLNFLNYSNTTTFKTILSKANTGSYGVDATASLWRSTSAINTISVYPFADSFDVGTTASLYGIRAEGVSPTTKATGGAVYSDDVYYYHVFGASGTFTPTQSITADYLVVAGGGGATVGGGGAGGLRSTVGATGGGGSLETALSLTAQAYTVTVGAGGSGGNTSVAAQGGDGTNSVFSTITAIGGGGGGGGNGNGAHNDGRSGGSGGGSHNGAQPRFPGSGTANQGFAGGALSDGGTGSGGGGAGGVGGNKTVLNTTGGVGGVGVAISSFATATGTGVSNYYAGGGGGFGTPPSAGGAGGGGTQGSGIANTGGGGGAVNPGVSGNGGSGVVIVRYAK